MSLRQQFDNIMQNLEELENMDSSEDFLRYVSLARRNAQIFKRYQIKDGECVRLTQRLLKMQRECDNLKKKQRILRERLDKEKKKTSITVEERNNLEMVLEGIQDAVLNGEKTSGDLLSLIDANSISSGSNRDSIN
ncbi:uncharacterized protein LOC118194577 [Stegodyphus dumicola]|uniref:uncharacterized protein LOC118194577 n=1 Tax=Stegodyphus dumicola TaxID=202533 RepID=UPI0015B1413C|nr:uncharacterized protein LOC118194577 [Stegodyphus dumicola]